ncbi:conjugative transposon protein TraM [Mucilaginibacter sp. L3T2-6]|uniref:conjugative transposon protein TraM n=1 Tax=Mucilaginibacter sp. L3T2-6 TaxID=3062491 RepID=UPI0026760A3C|nr:conjugative transposon protein TraM [Mucilaginibacter sp. L3T2-6]MDO3641513.1 conjugative transposon protein TraM [Mucilaginibacter sp. L3T2-6]MDV6213726.1 conjugative transposon protein TraM [Mucilaginibacter sp. L3T2-6]
MKEQTTEQQQQREKRKKFLLVLPLLILPFLVMAFWALGGGKGTDGRQSDISKGINTQLPEAKFKSDQPQDKLSLYDQAQRDSASEKSRSANPLAGSFGHSGNASMANNPDASEIKLSQKLEQLKQEVSKAPEPLVTALPATTKTAPAVNTTDVDRLEKLMKSMNTRDGDDPEMKQLESMVDKIIQIQHPELVAAQLKQQEKAAPDSLFKAIPALIDGDQKVLQGGIVKLRLSDSVDLKGIKLPKGFTLFGNCTITNQRLLLNIKNIRVGNAIIPVDLTVFSLDGMPGINAPEAELADATGGGAANAVQSMEFLPMDQTLATQAAGAGISAAKTLFSKKVKRVKVKLHEGERVLLRINKN